ncbi:MAG: O-antigen ligase family protein [Planctomycetes bacterium]|nr:O-antigen ligase family protein [Planctomycetota bacterium]
MTAAGPTLPAPARPDGPAVDPWLALLLAAITLPVEPGWIDFEQVRRGLLLAAAGVLAILGWRWCPRVPPRGLTALGLLCLWHLLGWPSATNPGSAAERALHLLALAIVFTWAGSRPLRGVLGAAALLGTVVSLHGLAQRAGLDWPAGIGSAAAPGSFLGNLNAAAEVAVVGLGAATALALRKRVALPWLATAAVCAGYLGVDGSRGGLVAAALALLAAAVLPAGEPRGVRRLAALGALVLVAALGWLGRAPRPDVLPTAGGATIARPSTVAIRTELWSASLEMVASAPLLGVGPGQFRHEYPRFRSQAEIEASTFGRRQPTFAPDPHQDALQIAVEAGLPGLLLALLLLARSLPAVLRRGPGRAAAPAVLAFLATALVRAPVGNAPAAAAFAALLGSAAAAPERARRRLGAWSKLGSALLGAALVAVGAMHVGAAHAAARGWPAAPTTADLDAAIALDRTESRYHSLRIQAICGLGSDGLLLHTGPAELARAADDIAAIRRFDPHNTTALFFAAQLLRGGARRGEAHELLHHILELDPRHPGAALLLAIDAAGAGELDTARALLYRDPHPSIRVRLAEHLRAIAAIPGIAKAGAWRREALFVAAVDALADPGSADPGSADPGSADPDSADPDSADAADRVLRFVGEAGSAESRGLVLRAHLMLRLGGDADTLAPAEPGALAAIDAGSRALLAPSFAALRALPGWARVLPPP